MWESGRQAGVFFCVCAFTSIQILRARFRYTIQYVDAAKQAHAASDVSGYFVCVSMCLVPVLAVCTKYLRRGAGREQMWAVFLDSSRHIWPYYTGFSEGGGPSRSQTTIS